MQEASIGSLIEDIFVILIIYYGIKFVMQLFLPLMARKVVEKANEQFQQQYQQNTNSQPQNKQAEKPKETKNVGEYIDYEEVE
ncbi:MAG: hypothetical protein RIQ59_2210 [Bacteroidota bacterium]|jgi:hypothetical protein